MINIYENPGMGHPRDRLQQNFAVDDCECDFTRKINQDYSRLHLYRVLEPILTGSIPTETRQQGEITNMSFICYVTTYSPSFTF